MIDSIQQQLAQNEIAQGGLFVVLIGSLAGILWRGALFSARALGRQFVVHARVRSVDPAYSWLSVWVAKNLPDRTRRITIL